MQVQIINTRSPRSRLVDVIAWISIALSVFATLVLLPQNVMTGAEPALEQAGASIGADSMQVSAVAAFLMVHLNSLFLLLLVASGAMLIAAIGLLRRKNWARIAFVAILSLGIAWAIAVFALQQLLLSSLPALLPGIPADFHALLDRMIFVADAFACFFAFVISGLFAWLIARLLSRSVRAEFG